MAQEITTPKDFPMDGDVSKGDKKKFIVEVECTDKDDDGKMTWEIETIDGVKVEGNTSDDEDEGIDENYDSSMDEDDSEDVSSDGKAKTTKGVGLLILGKK